MHLFLRFGALALVVVTAACGSGPMPTSPSAAPGRSPLGALLDSPGDGLFGPLEMRALTGRVTNLLTGVATPGITVNFHEIGPVAADATGQFTLESEAPDGRYRITASGAGVVSRVTSLTFPGQAPVVTLVPNTFNMAGLDELTRQFGEPGVMKRWIQAPALVVETSLLEPGPSFDPAGAPTATPVASAQQISEADIALVTARLARALPLMTGGALPAFSAITQRTTPAGEAVSLLTEGAITLVQYIRTPTTAAAACRGFGGLSYFEDYSAFSGYVYLQTCSDPLLAPALAAHELGHSLGYGHVAAILSVMKATVTDDITEFDRQATAIAFNRPPGNRAPDVDPETSSVNLPIPMRLGGRTAVVGPVP